jgi:hypothetical protein
MTLDQASVREAARRFARGQWSTLTSKASTNSIDTLARLVLAEHTEFDEDTLYTTGPAIQAWSSDDAFAEPVPLGIVESACIAPDRFCIMYDVPLISFYLPDTLAGILVNCRFGPRWGRGGWWDVTVDEGTCQLLERHLDGWVK